MSVFAFRAVDRGSDDENIRGDLKMGGGGVDLLKPAFNLGTPANDSRLLDVAQKLCFPGADPAWLTLPFFSLC